MRSTNATGPHRALSGVTLTRFQDVQSALHDRRLSSQLDLHSGWHFPALGRSLRNQAARAFHHWHTRSQQHAISGLSQHWMAFSDPPVHTRLRVFVKTALVPRVARIRPHIQAITDQLLAAAQSKGGMRVLEDWAFPLSELVIADLLGVPPADHIHFREWFVQPTVLFGQHPANTPAELVQSGEAIDYFSALLRKRRAQPQDDLISDLIRASEGDDGLGDADVIAMSMLLLVGGFETTERLLAAGLVHLVEQTRTGAAPALEPFLWHNAVEELMRYLSPLPILRRRAVGDIELNGIHIPHGTPVQLDLYAANHDPTQFANPDRLDLKRKPGFHLAFGRGVHTCIGASLARLEAEVAFHSVLALAPRMAAMSTPAPARYIGPNEFRAYEVTFAGNGGR